MELLLIRHGLPERADDDHALTVAWTLEALPESRGWTANIALLTGAGRLVEAAAPAAVMGEHAVGLEHFEGGADEAVLTLHHRVDLRL